MAFHSHGLELERIFPGSSEMAHRMRSFDWSQTVLGLPETWLLNLRTCVRIILTSRQPMFIWWGKELIHLYNDGYTAILGAKHPAALAQAAPLVWSEVWDVAGPRAEFAMNRDEGTYDEALPFIMLRKGYPEKPTSLSHIARFPTTWADSAASCARPARIRSALLASAS